MALEASNPVLQSVGSYDLLDKIAEGGMGSIYKGRHRESGRIVAVKVMPRNTANNAVLLRRFEQEFRAASLLDHPNIVRALDFGYQNNMPYLVMEFVDGESLGAKLEREGRMSPTDAIKLIVQVAQGLHRAHKQGLVHRDVKPDNVLVTVDGIAKLADLGLVKTSDADLNLTKTGRGLGTPHFMAPEQFKDAKNADARCDIYSLGATLYMMVTGELPFKSNGPLDAWMKKTNNELVAPRQIVPDIPERTEWAILRAMSPEKEHRPVTCREFVEDLTGHSTRRLPATDSSAPIHEFWYLVYKDDDGTLHTVKGTTAAIRRSLKEGLLGDASNVRASRTKAGPFEPLKFFPEFRDVALSPPGLLTALPVAAAQVATPLTASPVHDTPTTLGVPVKKEDSAAPHINLGIPSAFDRPPTEWVKWAILILIGVATAAATLFLLPHLNK